MSKHIVATVDEIPVGGRKVVEINGRSIGIFNVNGEFYALLNRCPHEGAALCDGTITGLRQSDRPGEYSYDRPGEIIRCPWHGWEYDIKTGQSWFDPDGVRVRPYPVTIEAGVDEAGVDEAGVDEAGVDEAMEHGYQPGPYVAESYPVEVDQSYVVVDLSRRA